MQFGTMYPKKTLLREESQSSVKIGINSNNNNFKQISINENASK